MSGKLKGWILVLAFICLAAFSDEPENPSGSPLPAPVLVPEPTGASPSATVPSLIGPSPLDPRLTESQRLDLLAEASADLLRNFPQLANRVRKINGYVYELITQPEAPQPALVIPLIGPKGYGKSSFEEAVQRAFHLKKRPPVMCDPNGESYLPLDTLLDVAALPPDPVFGLRGDLSIDEIGRVRAAQKEPDYAKIYTDAYEETLKAKRAELLATWERERREKHEEQIRLMLSPRQERLPAALRAAGGRKKKGKEKERERERDVEEEPPAPIESMPQSQFELPEFVLGDPPAQIEIDAKKHSVTFAESAVAKERKNWINSLNRRQIFRDATSSAGEILIKGNEHRDTLEKLRTAASAWAEAKLAAEATYDAQIAAASELHETAKTALEKFRPFDRFERLRQVKEDIARLEALDKQRIERAEKAERAAERLADRSAERQERGRGKDKEVPQPPVIVVARALTEITEEEMIRRHGELTTERTGLPTDADMERYDEAKKAADDAGKALGDLRRDKAHAESEAVAALVETLTKENIAEKLININVDVVHAFGGVEMRKGPELLLSEAAFLRRQMTERPVDSVEKILSFTRGRSDDTVRHAKGVFIFLMGTNDEYDHEAKEGATDQTDPDSLRASYDRLLPSTVGIQLRQDFQRRVLGRVIGADGKDIDEKSLWSRAGGLWEPLPVLTKAQWEEVIFTDLRNEGTNVTARLPQYGNASLQITFDNTVRDILYRSGMNAESDMRLFKNAWREFMGVYGLAMHAALRGLPPGVKTLVVRYNPSNYGHELEFVADNQVVYSESFVPNSVLSHVDVGARIEPDEIPMLAGGEAARLLMGTLLLGSFPILPKHLPNRILSIRDYWNIPQTRYWRLELAEVLTSMAAHQYQIRFKSGERTPEIHQLDERVMKRLEALQRKFNLDVPQDTNSRAVQLMMELTPKWFHLAEPIQAGLETSGADAIEKLAPELVDLIINFPDFQPVIRALYPVMVKAFEEPPLVAEQVETEGGQETAPPVAAPVVAQNAEVVPPVDPQEILKKSFLDQQNRWLRPELQRRLVERAYGEVHPEPESCEFSMAEQALRAVPAARRGWHWPDWLRFSFKWRRQNK